METNLANRLNEIGNQISYFQPTAEWQPQKYNIFLARMEQIINELIIIDELEIKNTTTNQDSLKKSNDLLKSYLILKEKYY